MRGLVLALIFGLAASSAQAGYFNRVVAANGALKNQTYQSLNPDCSSMGYPTVTVVTPPANGRLVVSKGRDFPNYPPSNPRSFCNTRRTPGTVVEYRPNRGFVGSDAFTLDIIYASGDERNDSFNITVK